MGIFNTKCYLIKVKILINFLFCLFPLITSERLSKCLYSMLCNMYCTHCNVGTVFFYHQDCKILHQSLVSFSILKQNHITSQLWYIVYCVENTVKCLYSMYFVCLTIRISKA